MSNKAQQSQQPAWSFELNSNQWSLWLGRWQTKYLGNIYDVVSEYLRSGYWNRVERGSRLLQIVINPAFDPVHSYELFDTLYVSKEAKTAYRNLLLKTTWDQAEDFERWKVEKPSLLIPRFEFKWVGMEREFVDSFAQQEIKLPQKNISLAEMRRLGNDGVLFELGFGGRFLGMRYFWWSKAPEEWQPLQSYLEATVKTFDELLENPLAETATSSN